MGTSSDYSGGKGGAWTPYKMAASNFVRYGGEPRVDKVLSRYVAVLGGAAAAASATSAASAGTIGAFGDFGAGVANDGLTATLQRLGLDHLVGKERWDVFDGLTEAFTGPGGQDDEAVQFALTQAFKELFPEDAQDYAELEATNLTGDDVSNLVESFVAWLAYVGLDKVLAKKYADLEDQSRVPERDREVRASLRALAGLELMGRDPLAIDWKGPEGQSIINRVIAKFYEGMEGAE